MFVCKCMFVGVSHSSSQVVYIGYEYMCLLGLLCFGVGYDENERGNIMGI